MILSFRSREKMSYARSPLPVCSTTIGTRPRFLFWTFIWKLEDYSMIPEWNIMLHTLWLNKRFVICLNISLNHGRKQIRKNNKSFRNESRRISCSRVSLYGNYIFQLEIISSSTNFLNFLLRSGSHKNRIRGYYLLNCIYCKYT